MSDEWQSFEKYAPHQLIVDWFLGRKSGQIQIAGEGIEQTLFFKEGEMLFASSSDPKTKLQEVLISMGLFDRQQYEEAEPNFKEELSIGRNLVEMGIITQPQMVDGARRQVYVIFRDAFKRKSGRMKILEGEIPGGIVRLPLDLPLDIFTSILAMDDKAWLSSYFGSDLDFIPEVNPEKSIDFNKIEVADFAADIYQLFDGEKDFHQIVFESEIDEFELLKFIYALTLLQYVHVPLDPDPEEEEDDLRMELTDAIARDEALSQLGNDNFDETVELDNVPELQVGGLDATTELAAPEEIRDETEEEPEPESEPELEATQDEEEPESFMGEEDPYSPADNAEIDQGLDDLSDLGELNLDNLAAIQETAQEEVFEEKKGFKLPGLAFLAGWRDRLKAGIEGLREKVKVPLPVLLGIVLVAAGLAFWVPRLLNDSAPTNEPTNESDALTDAEDAAKLFENEDSAKDPVPDDPDTSKPQEQPPDTENQEGDSTQPEPEPELESDPDPEPQQTQVERPIVADPDNPPPISPIVARYLDQNQNVQDQPLVDPDATSDPDRNQQAGRASASTADPQNSADQSDITAQTTEAPPDTQMGEHQLSGDPFELLEQGAYQQAAQKWRQDLASSQDLYTIGLELVCRESSVRYAITYSEKSADLFLLDRNRNNRVCFWVCWGRYSTFEEANQAIETLPQFFKDLTPPPKVYRLGQLF